MKKNLKKVCKGFTFTKWIKSYNVTIPKGYMVYAIDNDGNFIKWEEDANGKKINAPRQPINPRLDTK